MATGEGKRSTGDNSSNKSKRIQCKSFSLVLGDGSGIAKNGLPTGAPHKGKHNIILDTMELLCSIAAS